MNILKSKLNYDPTLQFWKGFFKGIAIIIGIIIGITLIVICVKRMVHTTNESFIESNVKNFAYEYVNNVYPKYSNCFSIDKVLILDTVYKRTTLYRERANIKDSLKTSNSIDKFSLVLINNLISLTDKDDIAWIDVVLFYHVNLTPSASDFNKIIYKYYPLDDYNNKYLINSNDKIKIQIK